MRTEEIELRKGVIVSLVGCDSWACARCGARLKVGDTAYFNIDQRVICGAGRPCNIYSPAASAPASTGS